MKGEEIVRGIVLAQSPVGDYDRRVVLLTLEHGKISVFAKGARKPTNALAAACQPFAFGTFTIYKGRSAYTLHHAKMENYFQTIREDLNLVYYGTYFMELAGALTREDNDERKIVVLLYQSLRALEKKVIPKELIRIIFEIKILDCFGIGMYVYGCMECQQQKGNFYYVNHRNGCLCEKCFKKQSLKGMLLDQSTLYALQFILSSKMQSLYSFQVSEPVLKQLQSIGRSYLKQNVQETFHSLEMIDFLKM